MTKAEAVALLKLRLGSREDTDLDALISAEADQAQRELEHTGEEPPWFLLSLGAAVTITASQRTASWPTGFLAEVEEGAFWLTNADGDLVLLDKGEYEASLHYWGTEEDQPVGYSTLGSDIQLFPIPDAAYTATVDCFISDNLFSTLADAETNNWLTYASDALLAKVGMKVAMYTRDSQLVTIFANELSVAVARMQREHIARMEVNRVRRMEA